MPCDDRLISACRYFSYIVECKNPKACTIVLRGAGKDFLMEVERNLQDAMNVARNVMVDARLVPGGGATEMAVACVSMSICSHQLTRIYQAARFSSAAGRFHDRHKNCEITHAWPVGFFRGGAFRNDSFH